MTTQLPMRPVVLPAVVRGQPNGKVSALMIDTPGQSGGPVVRLAPPAARAWRALCAAATAAGHTLTATSLYDSYRPYGVQESTFRARYTTAYLAGRPSVTWQGQTWYQRPGTASAAVPGTSNHGFGLAVDVANVDSSLSWLVANEVRFGWSHELTSEPWHIHYFAGDAIPYDESEATMFTAQVQGNTACWLSDGFKARPIVDGNELHALASAGARHVVFPNRAEMDKAVGRMVNPGEPDHVTLTADQLAAIAALVPAGTGSVDLTRLAEFVADELRDRLAE